MSDTAIRVNNLSKQYAIGRQRQAYKTLQDSIVQAATNLRQTLLQPLGENKISRDQEVFWALKDVSFEIKQGDRIGIIGHNGAGKSTLLKILSRITEPTAGSIAIKGRVASLLEVGTGFHQELSGRENIYLNGAILGMSRVEIRSKFDQIVEFAEIEKFLDTPVKRYSSGMYVRLAFAVAAHLEPEILIVDEVLAVGDSKFQQRCLGKMKDVSSEGRTVVFVSHQMGTIAKLCNQGILLEKGQISEQGDIKEVIAAYMQKVTFGESNQFIALNLDCSGKDIYIGKAITTNVAGLSTSEFGHDEQVQLEIHYNVNRFNSDVVLAIVLTDQYDRKIFTSEVLLSKLISRIREDSFVAKVMLPKNLLTPGQYTFMLAVSVPNVQMFDLIEGACKFTITDRGSEFSLYEGMDYGCVFANCQWSVETEL